MKKEFKNKLIFISGVVFAFALLIGMIAVIQAATTNSWSAPTKSFPQADVFAPLDTGNITQSRQASLAFENIVGSALILGKGNVITTSGGGGASLLISDPNNIMRIYGDGLALPRTGTASNSEGVLRYNASLKKAQINNGTAWTDLGGGDSAWTMKNGKLTYSGGDIVISNALQGTQTRFWLKQIVKIEGKQFSLVPTVYAEQYKSLGCDESIYDKECGDSYSGNFGDGSVPVIGNIGIDKFAECPVWYALPGVLDRTKSSATCTYIDEGGTWQHTGAPDFRRVEYVYETRDVGSPVDTATLSVFNLSVGGKITGSGSASPFVTGFLEGQVGNWSSDTHIIGSLPTGYNGSRCVTFMQGFRSEFVHGWDSSIVQSNDGKNIYMGSLAACWLNPGDKNVYASYAGDDYGPVDGSVRCGYLCW